MNNAEQIGIWHDAEGDILTVTWERRFGYYIDSSDERVLVRVDTEGNAIGFMVQGFSTLKDESLELSHGLDWWNQLEHTRGSQPRCVLLVDGNRGEVAKRLTRLVDIPDVTVSPNDKWIPYGKPVKQQDDSWDTTPAAETELGNPKKPNVLLLPEQHKQLTDWWLAVHKGPMTTPTWDIASTCTIKGHPGLLLIEAKSHVKELRKTDKSGSTKNRKQIDQAFGEANAYLGGLTGQPWGLSAESRYQLSNRFAWSWKLASMGIPVVLVYLGFLHAKDMKDRGDLFGSHSDWESTVEKYGEGVVDNNCWGKWLDVSGTPFIPLLRTFNQPFMPQV